VAFVEFCYKDGSFRRDVRVGLDALFSQPSDSLVHFVIRLFSQLVPWLVVVA